MSWIKNLWIVALALGAQGVSVAGESSLSELETQFSTPPAQTRIMKIIHNWPDDPAQQDQLRKRLLQDQGFGGIVSNVHFDQYMESDTHWKAFERAVGEAKKEGANLWLYDEKGYPSGNAGGLVLRKNPDWEAEGLLTISRFYAAEEKVDCEIPPGKLLYAQAIPLKEGEPQLEAALDLSSFIQEGKLQAKIPANHVLTLITQDKLYEGTHAEGNLHNHIPYINLLSKDATYEFARVTYQNYAQHFGDDLSKWFEATFTDEPSLMSVFLRSMPYACLPWSPDFPAIFKERAGYDIIPLLPLLTLDSAPTGQIARVKYDFWKTVGDLVAENYFGQIQDFCKQYHIPSGGHLISEESMATHIPFYGNFYACLRRLDAPSMDCLTSLPADVPWYVARLISSAAQLNQNPLVMSETSDHGQVYRPAGDKRPKRIVSVDEIRGTLGRQIVGGVNRFTSYYAWLERSDEQIRELNTWTGRSILLTQGGDQVSDVAVLYPVESCWPRYQPSRLWANDAPEVLSISGAYHTVMQSFWEEARDFTLIDSQAIRESSISKKSLKHPSGLNWRVIVLPSVDSLPLDIWKDLEKFVKKGGVLIATGALPKNSESDFPSQEVLEISKRLFGEKPISCKTHRGGGKTLFIPAGMENTTAQRVDALIEKDFEDEASQSPLKVTHRTFPDHEVYYVFNDSALPHEGTMRFASTGNAQRWDLNSGTVTPLEKAATYQYRFGPWNAVAFTFDRQLKRSLKNHLQELPQYQETLLPLAKPTVGAGEFVRAEITPQDGNSACHTHATLTKTNVDTYLFLSYTQALDLGGLELLGLDVRIPQNQRTPSQLLVVLREANGAEYLAQTSYTLGGRGKENYMRVYVPKSQFLLAGWSKDPNSKLDLDQVQELRVGWGGYFGVEGETVDFDVKDISVLKPQATQKKK